MKYAPLLTLLIACSSASAPDSEVRPETGGDTGTNVPVLDEGWYSLDGSVDVAGGQILEGTVELQLWKADDRGLPTSLCTETIQVSAPTSLPAPTDDVLLYGLWTIPLPVETCLGGPSQLSLGVGPLPRELWPATEAKGASLRHTRGLYTIVRRELVVFGLAGTAAQLEGRGAPTSLEPLPDGTYQLLTAFLLDL